MKLKYLFIILSLLVITPTLLLFYAAGKDGALPYIAWAIAVVVLFFLIYFYRKVLKPLNTIADGMDLLAAQDFSSRLSSVGQAETDRIVKLFNRLMDRVKEERLSLIEQNNFLSLLIEESPMGIILLDFNNCISMINPSAKLFLNITDDRIGDNLSSIDSPLMSEIIKIGEGERKTIRVDGTAIYSCSRLFFMSRGFKRPFIVIEPMTDEIFKAEKSAYEKVIRMIAHEVNNSVAGVVSALGSLDFMLQNATATSIESDMSDIRAVIKVCEERGYTMSRFIAAFANVVKIPEPQLRDMQLNDCVSSCIYFMKHMCGERNIQLETSLAEDSCLVRADITLFEQVLLNIIKNSIESIGENGKIVVETFASPARIVITDNGAGISPDDKERIFSPFFSTKTNGQGLGLMFVREILIKHSCSFSLATGADGLTRFVIAFPQGK